MGDDGLRTAALDVLRAEDARTNTDWQTCSIALWTQAAKLARAYLAWRYAPDGPPDVLLIMAYQQLVYLWNQTGICPCGARRRSPDTHPHALACPTERAIRMLADNPSPGVTP